MLTFLTSGSEADLIYRSLGNCRNGLEDLDFMQEANELP